MVNASIHFSHQSISLGTFKHSFCTPKHIVRYMRTFNFTPKYITWHIRTFIFTPLHNRLHAQAFAFHTKTYHHDRVEFGVYKTWASSDVCNLCVMFHVVRSSGEFDARSALAVNTANRLCYSHKRTLARRALHARCALGVCIGARRNDTKYTTQNLAATPCWKSWIVTIVSTMEEE